MTDGEAATTQYRYRAVIAGAITGIATCSVYPLLLIAPLPTRAAVVLAASMGPLLGAASWGLREFLNLDRRRLTADLGAISNALAGVLVAGMFLVQLAVREETAGKPSTEVQAVWLGLDVAWDVYIGLGTLMFALGATAHPRLGRLYGVSGVVIASALLTFNLATFPTPPADAGLIDVGPLVGLWYLAVTIVMLRSLDWVRRRTVASGVAVTGHAPPR